MAGSRNGKSRRKSSSHKKSTTAAGAASAGSDYGSADFDPSCSKNIAAPPVVDIPVTLPGGASIEVQGLASDSIGDVRTLLSQHPATCHQTSFSLSHKVRGPNLKSATDVAALKPLELEIIEEPYADAASAMAQVRRLAELVAPYNSSAPLSQRPQRTDASTGAELYPESNLSQFFSFHNVQIGGPCPISNVITITNDSHEGIYFTFQVTGPRGHCLTVAALYNGFVILENADTNCFEDTATADSTIVTAAPSIIDKSSVKHTLVALLRQKLPGFKESYGALLAAFSERNPFGNLPYGLRANNWVANPRKQPLPAEDPKLGGLTAERKVDIPESQWLLELQHCSTMPFSTSEERQSRDRRLFLVHTAYVDACTVNAAAAIHSDFEIGEMESLSQGISMSKSGHSMSAFKLANVDSLASSPMKTPTLDAVLKGLGNNENSVATDTMSLRQVTIHFAGRDAIFNPLPDDKLADLSSGSLRTEEEWESTQAYRGAHALNPNSLRINLQDVEVADSSTGRSLILRIVEETISKASDPCQHAKPYRRWELGSAWVNHLREEFEKKNNEKLASRKASTKTSNTAQHQQKQRGAEPSLPHRRGSHRQDDKLGLPPRAKDATDASIDNNTVQKKLGEKGIAVLKEIECDLWKMSISELEKASEQFYSDVSAGKVGEDLGALELAPVDGRTLTDLMHTRGLNMRSLGAVAQSAKNLYHIYSLCLHEMVTRAAKRLATYIMARTSKRAELSAALAAFLSAVLTNAETAESSAVWKWIEGYIKARFAFEFETVEFKKICLYKALLRGICVKCGIEILPKDYDIGNAKVEYPFQAGDVAGVVPVIKNVVFTSADGRTLLEESKAALDKGELERAVTCGLRAVAKLSAVCGAAHRLTAGALSLLAVVLYHTGDFHQAAVLQQRALDTNERELGLDHPDTMKAYGDLAVFYYRLQRTELALSYVDRAVYVLHLTCGPQHPNSAATYINVAMMEEGLGHNKLALRYLHEALKINKRLLGADHIQTAASYHAIAIALSLMEAFSLSVQHEQTTLRILEKKLGSDDVRTLDAQAWLEYFESKAIEQAEAQQLGRPLPDKNVASKGHLPVSDLLKFVENKTTTKEQSRRAVEEALDKEAIGTREESDDAVKNEKNPEEEAMRMAGGDEPKKSPEQETEKVVDQADISATSHVVKDSEMELKKEVGEHISMESGSSRVPASFGNTLEQTENQSPAVEDGEDEDGDWIETGKKKRIAQQSAESYKNGRHGAHRHLQNGSPTGKGNSQSRKGQKTGDFCAEGYKTRERNARGRHSTVPLQQKRRQQKDGAAGVKLVDTSTPNGHCANNSNADVSMSSTPALVSAPTSSLDPVPSSNPARNEQISSRLAESVSTTSETSDSTDDSKTDPESQKTDTSTASDTRSSAMNPNAAEFVPGRSWASCNIVPIPQAVFNRENQMPGEPTKTVEENGRPLWATNGVNGLKSAAAPENGLNVSVIKSPDGNENQRQTVSETTKNSVWNGIHTLVISDNKESASLQYAIPKDSPQGNGASGVSTSDGSRSDEDDNDDDDGFMLVMRSRRKRQPGDTSVAARWHGPGRNYRKNVDQREGRPHGQGHSSATPRVVSVN